MKNLSILLAFYILALTAVPCADDFISSSVEHPSKSASCNDSHHNTFDHCSPFCICNCCGTYVIHEADAMIITGIPYIHRDYLPYLPVHLSDPVFHIWQPPKLG